MIELIAVPFENDKIIPFEFEFSQNQGILIRTLPCLADFAEYFEKRYENCYSAREAIDEIRKHCAEITAPLGFCEDISSTYCIYEYSSDGTLINKNLIRGDSRLIKEEKEVRFEKKILFDVSECVRGGGIAAITVANGSIISVAAANASAGDDTFEITTETALGYRKRGLASSNAACLILELQKNGKSPIYKCRSVNTASVSVAERVGLTRVKTTYRYVGVRKNTI